MISPPSPLSGLRVLLVEDEFMVSMLIEDFLADRGCVLVGAFSNIAPALRVAETDGIDIALLDVNVGGEKIYPVAEALAKRNISFILLSGYGADAIPIDHPDWRAFSKPFRDDELADVMINQLQRHQGLQKPLN
jgi:DNA-binding response OmpR family regulator